MGREQTLLSDEPGMWNGLNDVVMRLNDPPSFSIKARVNTSRMFNSQTRAQTK